MPRNSRLQRTEVLHQPSPVEITEIQNGVIKARILREILHVLRENKELPIRK